MKKHEVEQIPVSVEEYKGLRILQCVVKGSPWEKVKGEGDDEEFYTARIDITCSFERESDANLFRDGLVTLVKRGWNAAMDGEGDEGEVVQ